MTKAARIRALAEQQGQVFLGELHRALGAATPAEKMAVRDGVKDLVRAGTLARLSPGLYEWRGDQRRGRPRVKTEELWRLMRYARQFTREQIRYRSGATLEHVKKCLEAWMRQGHIRRLGFQKKGQTREAVYRFVSDQVAAPLVTRKKKGATA